MPVMTPDTLKPPPPADIEGQLAGLRAALDRDVPAKAIDRNLIVATWRWEMMFDLDAAWQPTNGRATWRTVECFAEVLSRFDIIGIQGVMASSVVLQAVLDRLGPQWSYTMTLLEGPTTYKERTALVFDTRRAVQRGLAGQLVLSHGSTGGDGSVTASSQFYRPPQYAAFRVLDDDLAIANIHLMWGTAEERLGEMKSFVGAARRLADDGNVGLANTIALGQLQLISMTSELTKALLAAGLTIPPGLHDNATFVNSAGTPASMVSSIVWFKSEGSGLDERYRSAGVFNHTEHFGPVSDMTSHLPAWVEFSARPVRW